MASQLDVESEAPVGEVSLAELEERARQAANGRPLPLREWVALAEGWRIAQALREARGNRSAAARALGIGRRTLYAKIERLGLTPVWFVGRRSPNLRHNGADSDAA